MIKGYFHDGDEIKNKATKFDLNILDMNTDTRKVAVYDENDRETGGKIVLDFVGFITDEENETYVCFPKHFVVTDVVKDSRLIFECIQKHKQDHPDLYFGQENNLEYESNYPFSSFFNIYKYFRKFGLFKKFNNRILPNSKGKINWKKTISNGQKFISHGNYIPFPIYYNKKDYLYNFVTNCMIYAIDSTIEKFSFLIDEEKTGEPFPNDDIFKSVEGRKEIIGNLGIVRSVTYKDMDRRLLTDLIKFFSCFRNGGSFYLKHHTFSSVWEDMIRKYLDRNFVGVDQCDDDSLIFSKGANKGYSFKKKSFYPNDANNKQYISPDYYYDDGTYQFIFDAKYYNTVSGINYKQVAYVLFLRDKLDEYGKKHIKTFSALILPSEKRKTKLHFKMNKNFSRLFKNLIIREEYLDIKLVIEDFVEN